VSPPQAFVENLEDLLYLGVRQQWSHTARELLDRIRRGLPFGATRLAFSDIPFTPRREFAPRMAVGERGLPLFPRAVDVPRAEDITGARMAQALREAPLRDPATYESFVRRLGEEGVGPSYLGITSRGRPMYMPTVYAARRESLEEMHERLPWMTVSPGQAPEARVLPTTYLPPYKGSQIYQDIMWSFRENPASARALHESAQPIEEFIRTGQGSEQTKDLVRWTAQFAPPLPGGAERTEQDKIKWALQSLRGLAHPSGSERARALVNLYDHILGKEGLELYRPQSSMTTEIKKAIRLVDLRIAERLGTPTKGGTERAMLPAVRRAWLDSAFEDVYGRGAMNIVRPMAGWLREGKGKGAKAARLWAGLTFGRAPETPEDLILSFAGAVRNMLGRARGFALLQGLGGLMLDDMSVEAVSPVRTKAVQAIYEKFARSLFTGAGGRLLGLGAVAAIASIPLLTPKPSEAAPPGGEEIVDGFLRAATHSAGVVGGRAADERLGEDFLSRSGGAVAEFLHRAWEFLGSREFAAITDSTERLRSSLPDPLYQQLHTQTQEMLQSLMNGAWRQRGLAEPAFGVLDDINHMISEHGADGLAARQQIRAMMEGDARARSSAPPWMVDAADRLRDLAGRADPAAPGRGLGGFIGLAQRADPEHVRPYRMNYHPLVMDPRKLQDFMSNPALVAERAQYFVLERTRQLQGMAARSPTEFWAEVRKYLGTPEVNALRRRIQGMPGNQAQRLYAQREIFHEIADKEWKRTLAEMQRTVRVPSASRIVEDMVVGEGEIPPFAGPLGISRRPLPLSPYLTNARTFGFTELRYDDPLDEWRVYIQRAASHIAWREQLGPNGEKLRAFQEFMAEVRSRTTDPQDAEHLWKRLWEPLFDRTLGRVREDTLSDVMDKINRVAIPLAISTRMTTTAIPHIFQTMNAAVLNGWGSYIKAVAQIARGAVQEILPFTRVTDEDYRAALRLSELASATHSFESLIRGNPNASLETWAAKWLELIRFSPVRRVLLASSALTAHKELIPMIREAMYDPGRIPTLKTYLQRVQFGRRLAPEEASRISARLIEQMRTGGVPEDIHEAIRVHDPFRPGAPREDPYLRVISQAVDMTAFNFRPWDFPAFWNTSLGRTMVLFRRYFYQQWNNMYRLALDDAKNGNLVPLVTLLGPQSLVGGLVLGTVRGWINGRPAPWADPREKPFRIGGVTLPQDLQTVIQAEEEGGGAGIMSDAWRVLADPNQPYLGWAGAIVGFIPMEMLRLVTTSGEAVQATVLGGLDPQKTSDFAAARNFMRVAAMNVPFLRGRLLQLPIMRTGRAHYLELRRQALDAAVSGDDTMFSEINGQLYDLYGVTLDENDVANEMLRRQRQQAGEPTRAPLRGAPGYTPPVPRLGGSVLRGVISP